ASRSGQLQVIVSSLVKARTGEISSRFDTFNLSPVTIPLSIAGAASWSRTLTFHLGLSSLSLARTASTCWDGGRAATSLTHGSSTAGLAAAASLRSNQAFRATLPPRLTVKVFVLKLSSASAPASVTSSSYSPLPADTALTL